MKEVIVHKNFKVMNPIHLRMDNGGLNNIGKYKNKYIMRIEIQYLINH